MIKAQAGIVFDECARCAVLLFGGNGFTQGGQGELVERESHNALAVHLLRMLQVSIAKCQAQEFQVCAFCKLGILSHFIFRQAEVKMFFLTWA